MKKLVSTGFVLAFLTAAIGGCGSGSSAPRLPSGEPYTVYVYINSGVTAETPAGHVERLNELAQIMGDNLVDHLTNAGYASAVMADPSQFSPGPGTYLVTVEVTNYVNAFVSATLAVSYSLSEQIGAPLFAGSRNDATTRGWQRLVRTVNANIVEEVNAHFMQGQQP